MRPLPTLARDGGGRDGGSGTRADLEKGYVRGLERRAEEENRRTVGRQRENI